MKALIIYNTMSGNTEDLANKMKSILEKYNHECDKFRDKNIKLQVKENSNFFDSYNLICLGSCTHAFAPAISFKRFLKKIPRENLANKKLICFATSGNKNAWKTTCKKIQKKIPELEHIGNIGCIEKENDDAVSALEDLMKK